MWELAGRLHPLVVHLPIGILVFAGLAGLFLKEESINRYRSALRLVYIAGTGFAVLSIITGLNLEGLSSYEEGNVFWHKWLGITIAAWSILLFWYLKNYQSKLVFRLLNLFMLLGLTITGHLGGRMTHGPHYLLPPDTLFRKNDFSRINDSTELFTEIIFPVVQSKCLRCHQPGADNGGLDMTSLESLLAGTPNGKVIEPGNAANSEFFKRVSLPANHPRFMPPNGPGLSYDEVRLIEWFIDLGADGKQNIGDLLQDPDNNKFIEKVFGIHRGALDPLASLAVPEVTPALLDSLNELGFSVKKVSATSNVLDVVPGKPNIKLTSAQLSGLLHIKEQTVWLNLAGTQLTDDDLELISQLKNLRKLRIENNSISDKGLISLEGLEYLESLNLYGTGISDAGLGSLAKLKELKELYIGQTRVSGQGIKSLQQSNPALDISGQATLFDVPK
jgi:uncharacterized membrane protein